MNVRTKGRSSNLKILLNVTCKTNALNPIVFFGSGVEVRRYGWYIGWGFGNFIILVGTCVNIGCSNISENINLIPITITGKRVITNDGTVMWAYELYIFCKNTNTASTYDLLMIADTNFFFSLSLFFRKYLSIRNHKYWGHISENLKRWKTYLNYKKFDG